MKENYIIANISIHIQYIFVHVPLEKCADEFGKRKVSKFICTYNDFTWTEQQLIQNKEIISAYYKIEI